MLNYELTVCDQVSSQDEVNRGKQNRAAAAYIATTESPLDAVDRLAAKAEFAGRIGPVKCPRVREMPQCAK